MSSKLRGRSGERAVVGMGDLNGLMDRYGLDFSFSDT